MSDRLLTERDIPHRVSTALRIARHSYSLQVKKHSEVPQLVEALGHKTGGSGFYYRYGPWK